MNSQIFLTATARRTQSATARTRALARSGAGGPDKFKHGRLSPPLVLELPEKVTCQKTVRYAEPRPRPQVRMKSIIPFQATRAAQIYEIKECPFGIEQCLA